jgi:putative flavoprotein involved in K+ transport
MRRERKVADEILDVAVIGGGQAGLGIGYHLRQQGRSFTILERGRVGESWISQRWDSFTLNTPNWMNALPGKPYDGPEPDGFGTSGELVDYFADYVAEFELPVQEGVTVTSVETSDADDLFTLTMEAATGSDGTLRARQVVVAAGIQLNPQTSAIAADFPERIRQVHTADYRTAADLPDGAVLVVGAGQSGCQIVEDLLDSGRSVYLCTSQVGRVPRRYRGRDALEWWNEAGMWETQPHQLEDPAMRYASQPQISGVGRYGRTVSLQHMASQGAQLMGRLAAVEGEMLTTDDSLAENIAAADARSALIKAMIDAFIEAKGIDAPPAEIDPRDDPAPPGLGDSGLTELDLATAGVNSVVWCTGFGGSFDWIHVPAFDEHGTPVHERGVSKVPGLYFLGFPWLYTRKSGVIHGITEDSAHLAEVINSELVDG